MSNALATYRADFPALNEPMNGKRLAYMDSASSAQKPQVVIDAMNDVLTHSYANIHRGLYANSQTTTQLYEDVRVKLANFINANSENEIVFTRNSTEAMNLVAQSWARNILQAGDEIILTTMEHHANIVPWQILEEQIGIQLKVVPILEDGSLDFGAFMALLSSKTKLVTLVHISNSLGTVNPVRKIVKATKNFDENIICMIDGSQSAVHSKVDVQDLGCDFFALTGHKLYGPNGVGILWGKFDLLNSMPPFLGGGDMIETVSFDGTVYKAAPFKFEAGTPAIVEVIGLGAAIDYLNAIGMDAIAVHEKEMLNYMVQKLGTIEGLNFYGTAQEKAGIISFTADWAHISDIAMILDQQGVALRTGHHCCMPLMQELGIEGTARASIGLYTNKEDIDQLVSALEKAKEMLS
ncbi:MAG: cysteine desulfurase [Micavibrio sp.]|nr:cysteine desulfurase [Micavibrio sp.]